MNDNQNIYATPAGSNAVNNNNNNNDIINITNNGVSPSPRTPQSTNMNSFSNSNFPFPTPPPNLGQRTYDFDGKPEEWKKYQPNVIRNEMEKRLSSVTKQFKSELENIKNQNRDL